VESAGDAVSYDPTHVPGYGAGRAPAPPEVPGSRAMPPPEAFVAEIRERFDALRETIADTGIPDRVNVSHARLTDLSAAIAASGEAGPRPHPQPPREGVMTMSTKPRPTLAEARRNFASWVVISRSDLSDSYLCSAVYSTLREAVRWARPEDSIFRISLSKPRRTRAKATRAPGEGA
jgi:hypothetical protein